ncbi:MAG: hypothetical protein D6798_05185 [Deltaproteobacteria bacterium]|nr:MAG: hypothetical protein D6798_05185 [Deltaproteobacteria bacterium]
MPYCTPPPDCDASGVAACACYEEDFVTVSLVAVSGTELLLNAEFDEPMAYELTWRADGGSSHTITNDSGRSSVTLRLDPGCVDSLRVDIDAVAYTAPDTSGDGNSMDGPSSPGPYDSFYSHTFDVGCVPYALDSVTSSPSTLRRGQWLTITLEGSGFGSPADGSVQFYSPTGTLLADLDGTLRGDPDIDIDWSDDEIQVRIGPGYTSTYPLGWFPFKARVNSDLDGYTDLVWSGFTVTN